jgi:hypothetical protein
MIFQKNSRNDDHTIVIDISNNSPTEATKYYCSHCNSSLIPLVQEEMKGCYICTKCVIEYWPNQQPVKKADKFDLPGPATDSHGNILGDIDIPMVVMDSPEPSSTNFKQKKLTAAYEALSRYGFKFITYEEK